MGLHHHHDHHHDHAHEGGHNQLRRLHWVFILTLGFLFAEVIGGILSNSLALLADAGHMFGDSTSLGIAMAFLPEFLALYIMLSATRNKSFGLSP